YEAVAAVRRLRPEQEIGVPQGRQGAVGKVEQALHRWRPVALETGAQSLEGHLVWRQHGLCRGQAEHIARLRRELPREAHEPAARHVAAHHAFDDARLVRMVDQPALAGEVLPAMVEEFAQRHLDRRAVAMRRLLQAQARSFERGDLPDTLAAIAAMLLQDTNTACGKLKRKAAREVSGGAVESGVAAPAEFARRVKDFLGSDLEDRVRMRADPDAGDRRVAQDRVQIGTVAA